LIYRSSHTVKKGVAFRRTFKGRVIRALRLKGECFAAKATTASARYAKLNNDITRFHTGTYFNPREVRY
ncbi:MAG TPA: hypothetical protein VK658_03505, partial [Chryseolinea sp.]|nr:hypothetical protein [Chryseolinea sp.]